MAWTEMIDGKCLPVVWFESTVNAEVYHEFLQHTVWRSGESVQHEHRIDTSMKVCIVMLRGRAWTFSNQSLRIASYPIFWNINGQQTLRISHQWFFLFRIRHLLTSEKSNLEAWKT